MHESILTLLCLIDWVANDLHYKTRGAEFYSCHLLADRVRDFGSAKDDLKESYWLGQLNENPPDDVKITEYTTKCYGAMVADFPETDNRYLLRRLEYAIGMLHGQIEQCKKDTSLSAGVHAILDSISQKALTYLFLVRSQI